MRDVFSTKDQNLLYMNMFLRCKILPITRRAQFKQKGKAMTYLERSWERVTDSIIDGAHFNHERSVLQHRRPWKKPLFGLLGGEEEMQESRRNDMLDIYQLVIQVILNFACTIFVVANTTQIVMQHHCLYISC